MADAASTTRDRATVRAGFVQAKINDLRDAVVNGHHEGALLASYDRELTRLCQIPGVLSALLAEMVIEETTP